MGKDSNYSEQIHSHSPVKGMIEDNFQDVDIMGDVGDQEGSIRCNIDTSDTDSLVTATLEGSNIIKRVNIFDITNKSNDLLRSLAQQDEPFWFSTHQ